MNIFNQITTKKESCLNKENNILSNLSLIFLMAILFVASFFILVKGASADNSEFEIPACVFETQEGRTVANFSDKKIVSWASQEDAESGPVSVDILAGSYKVSLFSYDGYEGREEASPQPKETCTPARQDYCTRYCLTYRYCSKRTGKKESRRGGLSPRLLFGISR